MRKIIFILLLSLLLVGCSIDNLGKNLADNSPKTFTFSSEDGSSISLQIQYKPEGCSESDKTVGCSFYIVKYFPKGESNRVVKSTEKTKDKTQCSNVRLSFRFYDKNNFSLYNGGDFAPGWNINEDEFNELEDRCEWKGVIHESSLSYANFLEIFSVKVERI